MLEASPLRRRTGEPVTKQSRSVSTGCRAASTQLDPQKQVRVEDHMLDIANDGSLFLTFPRPHCLCLHCGRLQIGCTVNMYLGVGFRRRSAGVIHSTPTKLRYSRILQCVLGIKFEQYFILDHSVFRSLLQRHRYDLQCRAHVLTRPGSTDADSGYLGMAAILEWAKLVRELRHGAPPPTPDRRSGYWG